MVEEEEEGTEVRVRRKMREGLLLGRLRNEPPPQNQAGRKGSWRESWRRKGGRRGWILWRG